MRALTPPAVGGTTDTSAQGRDTGDVQIFINLVDNPRADHEYSVFGAVAPGIDTVDRILEGDIIEGIHILRGSWGSWTASPREKR